MRRLSFWGSSKRWVWSMAMLAATPAVAAEPDGPMLFGIVDEPAAAAQAAPAGMTEAERIREARRLLLDFPGSDPLAAAANEILFFGATADDAPAAVQPEEDLAPQDDLDVVELDEITLDDLSVAPQAQSAPSSQSAPISQPASSTTATDARPQATIPLPAAATASKQNDFSPEMLKLCEKMRTVLGRYYPRHQNSRDNSPWEVMHAIIAYGVDTQIYKDGPNGEKVNAIGYMTYNYPCREQRMLLVNRGKVDASRGVGVQGHAGQFLAILAQSHVKSDYPMLVEGKKFTLQDLINREMETCVAGEELTFKLIALSHYLDSDATWTTPNGQQWSIERLVREELKAPIRGAACGGTHRLMGYSYALRKRAQQGKEITGDFKRAQIYLRDYHRYTFGLQNPDGSFSTAWFERKGAEPSIDRRLKTTGHILEWISYSLSEDELRDPRMVKAVEYLTNLMLTNDRHTWEIGPQGHALHALMIYENRVFKDVVPMKEPSLADEEQSALWHEARRSESR